MENGRGEQVILAGENRTEQRKKKTKTVINREAEAVRAECRVRAIEVGEGNLCQYQSITHSMKDKRITCSLVMTYCFVGKLQLSAAY